MRDWIGWLATAIFALSYIFKSHVVLRWVQAAAASLLVAFGLLIGSAPVVVANLVVAATAVLSVIRERSGSKRHASRSVDEHA